MPSANNQPCSFQSAKYYEQSDDGRHLIEVDGKRGLVSANVYHIYKKLDETGKRKKMRRHVSTTPGYEPDDSTDVTFEADCQKTNKRYRITCCLESLSKYKHRSAPYDSAADVRGMQKGGEAQPHKRSDVCLTKKDFLNDKGQDTPLDLNELKAFKRELAIIKAQIEAGFDPVVSVNTACMLSNRSRATIYRDIKEGRLPAPAKNGRSSNFPYSAVMAYARSENLNEAVSALPSCKINKQQAQAQHAVYSDGQARDTRKRLETTVKMGKSAGPFNDKNDGRPAVISKPGNLFR